MHPKHELLTHTSGRLLVSNSKLNSSSSECNAKSGKHTHTPPGRSFPDAGADRPVNGVGGRYINLSLLIILRREYQITASSGESTKVGVKSERPPPTCKIINPSTL